MPEKSGAKPSLIRRHPFASGVTLLAVIALATAVLFLATFDLNAYRQSLAERLSSTLNQPVSIGSAEMSWRRGPAFHFSTIRIGKADQEPTGEIAHLFLQPRLLPLLSGKVVFHDMIVDRPHYRLQLPLPSAARDRGQPATLLTALLETVQVRKLTVIAGRLSLSDRRDENAPPLEIDGIGLRVINLAGRGPIRLQLKATLAQPQAPAVLEAGGRITLDGASSDWHRSTGELHVVLQNLDLEQLLAQPAVTIDAPRPTGTATLDLALQGGPATGLHFSADLTGPNLHLVWPNHYNRPPALAECTVSGIWKASKNLDSFKDLKVRVDDLQLRGHLSLQHHREQPWFEGNLASPELELAKIRPFLPSKLRLTAPLLDNSLAQGRVRLRHLRFAGPLAHFQSGSTTVPVTEGRIDLHGGRIAWQELPALEQVACSLVLQQGKLHLTAGSARLLEGPLRFSGTATLPEGDRLPVSFDAAWDAPVAALLQQMKSSPSVPLMGSGTIPLTLSLRDTPNGLQARVRADLAGAALELPDIFSKPAGRPGTIDLGLRQKEGWIVEQGRIQLAPFDLQLNGRLGLSETAPWDLQLELLPTDLGQATQPMPFMAAYPVEGKLSAQGRLSGPYRAPTFHGQARLTDAVLKIEEIEAAIRQINGVIAIEGRECHLRGARAVLGASPVTLDGTLQMHPEPSFRLGVKASSVRADELIFPGSEALFTNLSGSMLFTSAGIRYRDIRFNMQHGRNFHLQGEQLHTTPTAVALDIRAEQASIDEVLALWPDAPPSEAPAATDDDDLRLHIDAVVEQGSFGNLLFTDARATIVSEGERITIAPLTFSPGSGSGRGKITIDNSDDRQTMLDIEAQLQEVEAENLYSDLLKARGLVSGKLSGQIQLQGPAGAELLTQGSGRADIHIEDGVLRRFSFLSKVFSLLNISQIFTLHLPDMAKQGMPFTALDGTFDLQKGKLATEDLKVASNAMNLSLVGNYDLQQDRFDLVMGIKPFGTVDKLITRIPIAGWLLAGEEKALITAHFEIKGPANEPEVKAIPVSSISGKVLGIFKRVLGLPGKLVTDPGQVITGKPQQAD